MISKEPSADEHMQRNDEKAFLESILAQHEKLELNEAQFHKLSRLYWDRSKQTSMIDTIAAVASTLSSDQFAKAVALLVPQMGANPGHRVVLDTTVDKLVAEALEKQSKEQATRRGGTGDERR